MAPLSIPSTFLSSLDSFVLLAVPFFLLGGNIMARCGPAKYLFEAIDAFVGHIPGGLPFATVVTCMVFAAITGSTLATLVSVGTIAVPPMVSLGYPKRFCLGLMCVSGTLGQLIPPSIYMILYGSYVQESAAMLFAGGMIPGLILSSLFIIYILVRSLLQPNLAPALPPEARASWRDKLISLRAVILPIVLIVVVLGSILAGMATPSEAAGIGAFGSIICAAVYGRLNWRMFKEACDQTLRLSAMVMWIIFGACCLSVAYIAVGADELIENVLIGLPGGRWGPLITMVFIWVVLGCFLDNFGILAITTPVFFPVVRTLGFDPLWFGILYVLTIETSYLTPPFGFNLFFMKGITPFIKRETGINISMGDIYRSIVPFFLIQLVALILVMIFPQLALWLPNVVFGVK
jgi:tripartite ATP-independent transporter DctM subunit